MSGQYLGIMPLFADYRVLSGHRHDWVLVNLADDPVFQDPDGYPVPRHVLRRLHAIKQSGVDFDALYIAHQVPLGMVQEAEQLVAEMLLPPPPKAVQRLSAHLGFMGHVLWRLITLPIAVISALAGSTTFASTAEGSNVGLDPLLLGVVVGSDRRAVPGEPAAWFYLGHWTYNK
jgi:hypothetical protein